MRSRRERELSESGVRARSHPSRRVARTRVHPGSSTGETRRGSQCRLGIRHGSTHGCSHESSELRLLLNGGANAQIPDSKGITLLHLAVKRDYRQIVEMMLSPGIEELDSVYLYKDYADKPTIDLLRERMFDLTFRVPSFRNRKPNVCDLFYHMAVNDPYDFQKCLSLIPMQIFNASVRALLSRATRVPSFFTRAIFDRLDDVEVAARTCVDLVDLLRGPDLKLAKEISRQTAEIPREESSLFRLQKLLQRCVRHSTNQRSRVNEALLSLFAERQNVPRASSESDDETCSSAILVTAILDRLERENAASRFEIDVSVLIRMARCDHVVRSLMHHAALRNLKMTTLV